MPEIFLDGELIAFVGPPPQSLEALVAAVEPVLAGRGRVLAGVLADGVPLDEQALAFDEKVRRVDVQSLTITEALARVALECATRAHALREELERLAGDVMRMAWSDIAGACVTSATRAGELLRDAGAVVEAVSDLRVSAEGTADAVNRWISAIEGRDAAAICLALDCAVIPAFDAFARELRSVGGAS